MYENTAAALFRDAAVEGNEGNSSIRPLVEVNGWLIDQHLNMRSSQCTFLFKQTCGRGRARQTCQPCSAAFAKANVSRDNKKRDPAVSKGQNEVLQKQNRTLQKSRFYYKAKLRVLRDMQNSGRLIEVKHAGQNAALGQMLLEVEERKVDCPKPEEYGYYFFVLWQESVKATTVGAPKARMKKCIKTNNPPGGYTGPAKSFRVNGICRSQNCHKLFARDVNAAINIPYVYGKCVHNRLHRMDRPRHLTRTPYLASSSYTHDSS